MKLSRRVRTKIKIRKYKKDKYKKQKDANCVNEFQIYTIMFWVSLKNENNFFIYYYYIFHNLSIFFLGAKKQKEANCVIFKSIL